CTSTAPFVFSETAFPQAVKTLPQGLALGASVAIRTFAGACPACAAADKVTEPAVSTAASFLYILTFLNFGVVRACALWSTGRATGKSGVFRHFLPEFPKRRLASSPDRDARRSACN